MSPEPIKVLLIEDNLGDTRLIGEMLAEAKGTTFHLECAERLKTGLERLAKGGIDVVLLDLGLPESQGLDTFASASAQAPGVPIVVLTVLDDETAGVEAVQAGAQDYLVKGQVETRLLTRSLHYAVERQRVEQARENLLKTIEIAKEAICISSPHGTIIYTNTAMDELFGYEKGELVGKYPSALNAGPRPEAVTEKIMEAIKEQGFWEGEIHNKRKDGTEFISYAAISPFKDKDGKVLNFVSTQHDITQRRHLESQIVQISSREKRRIGQDLHDGLGQHLTGIAFLSKVLERKLAAKSLAEAADAQEIAKLVNQAIVESQRLARGLCPVDLRADGLMLALEEFAANVEKLFSISCNFKCEKSVLIYDNHTATHLYRIAQEAVDNAIKHSEAKHVLIGLSNVNDRTTLTVKDDGVGIPEVLDKHKGMGLNIMNYRTRTIGASFDVRRDTEGGTIVTCSFQNISDKK